jgi:hypothetical protein
MFELQLHFAVKVKLTVIVKKSLFSSFRDFF